MSEIILIMGFIIISETGFCQVKDATIKEILKVESQISKAILDNDTAKLSALLTNDYSFSVPEGDNISKKQFLLDMKTFWHPTALIHAEQQVKTYKNAATVTGLATYKWKDSTRKYEAYERYTDTYIRVKNQWLKSISHSSEAQQKDKKVHENEVKTTVETLWKAWETGNKSLAEPIYANDFIDTDFEGTRRNRTQVLDFLTPLPNGQTAKIALSDWHFIVKNNTVIVNYIGEDTRTQNGKTSTFRFRATDTFIKKYGHWQIVAGQQIMTKK
jgi:Domain of unknown function (DUF4440)